MLYVPHYYVEDYELSPFDVGRVIAIFRRWARMKSDPSIAEQVEALNKQLSNAYRSDWLNK